MLKDITLGQYFPGETLIHRLDPRTKLLAVIVFIVALFLAKSFFSYGLVLVFLIACIRISRVHLKVILRGLKPLLIIIVLTGLLNLFYTQGTVLVHFWIFTITKEGLIMASLMILRIIMLITGTFLLTYTTSPIALTDGLELLLSPLKKIKVPIHELSMMMCIALRFIPTLIEETDKIMSAQKARGADFESGHLIQRAKALVPMLPRRRGADSDEAAALRHAGPLGRACDGRAVGRCHRPAQHWILGGEEYAEHRPLPVL